MSFQNQSADDYLIGVSTTDESIASLTTTEVDSTTTGSSIISNENPQTNDVHPEAELINQLLIKKNLAYKLDVEPPPYRLPRVRPIVIGHRGSIYEEPENTIPSFQRAIQLGCDGIETDVFKVADGTLIAFHADDSEGNIEDYCGVADGNIMEYTYEEIEEEIDLNHLDKSVFPCSEKKVKRAVIPTMREALELFKEHGTKVFAELKGPDTEEAIVELVDELEMIEQVVFLSFQEERLQKIRDMRPERGEDGNYIYRVALLFIKVPEDFIERALRVGAAEVHLRYDACTVKRVDAIHAQNMKSLAWFGSPKVMKKDGTLKYLDVFNEDENMYQCVLNSGVQQMCVNRPKKLLKMIESQTLLPPTMLAEVLTELGAAIDTNSTSSCEENNNLLEAVNVKAEQLIEDFLENVSNDVEIASSILTQTHGGGGGSGQRQ